MFNYLDFLCSNLGKGVIHVIGYGLLSVGTSKLLIEALETHKFNFIILDESHYLKTRKAARTKRLHQLCKKAKHAILLSGTSSLARPREVSIKDTLYTLYTFDSCLLDILLLLRPMIFHAVIFYPNLLHLSLVQTCPFSSVQL